MRTLKFMPSEELLNKYPDLRDEYNAFVRQLKNKSNTTEKIRQELAEKHLVGHGLEIGAFHKPNPLPLNVTVDYVDQVSVKDLKKRFPSMQDFHCVSPKIFDNGEVLSKVENESYDFLIANHMLEHTENLFKTIQNHLRVIKPGGYLFYAIPDKKYTFDKNRELTTYIHLKNEYLHGSLHNRREHYLDGHINIGKLSGEKLTRKLEESLKRGLDMHFHVWTPESFLEHIQSAINDKIIEATIIDHIDSQSWESVTILQKTRVKI